MTTECFFSSDIIELHSNAFLVCYCVVGRLTVHGSTMFLILVFMFLKYVILCVYPWGDLLWYTFFLIFQDIVWLVNSSWYFHWCSIHQFYWISGRCRSEYALWWFFVQKSCRQCWQFFFLFCLDYQTFLEFSQIWRTELLFGVDNAFFTC